MSDKNLKLNGARSRLNLNQDILELREQRKRKQAEINKFTQRYGLKLTKHPEIERGQRCLLDFVLDEVQKSQSSYVTSLRDLKRFKAKKLAKAASNHIRKQKKKIAEAAKSKRRKKRDLARQLSKMVYRNFWQGTFKIHKFSLQ